MSLRVPLGVSDFRKLREEGFEYVDKSDLIRQILDKGVEVALLPRPRRFGKTLNLSMLRCFFEKHPEDLSPLFEGLSIWRAGERYRDHFQRYPVIYMTFKEAKLETFDACVELIQKKIAQLFDEHRAVLDGGRLSEVARRNYRQILDGNASRALYADALGDLAGYLHLHHAQKTIILIDEYDAPIHAGYVHGYSAPILEFFRAFLSGGLKDNPHLHRAVLTGILRVARESIFSGLNNMAVYSLLREDFSACFGFTEAEVGALLDKAGRHHLRDAVRVWYNGYVFGETVIYNPWSILSFLDGKEDRPQPFWIATSSNDLVRELLQERAMELGPTLESLVEGGSIDRALDEHVPLGELTTNEGALWSLLVFSGYLKAEKLPGSAMDPLTHRLSIPNQEVRQVYTSTFRRWIEDRLRGHGGSLARLTGALLRGDAERFEVQLQAFVTSVLSYHDARVADPEQVYHAFVLGLLAALDPEYQVRSNRESGQGRPDVMIRPAQPGKPGVVLELKVARAGRKRKKKALEAGVEQIQRGDYAAELRAAGASPVHAFAVAFDGKTVRVRGAA